MPKCEYCEIRGWGGKAFCHKKDDYVTDDFYYDFCNTYKYDDCPYYRGSSSGCYLTTACVDAMELPDDCLELQTMRRLRDEYILPNIENGRKIVEEYYAKAPQIVSAINAKENSIEIWKDIYLNEITPCVKTALQEGFHSAYEKYSDMTQKLLNKYLPDQDGGKKMNYNELVQEAENKISNKEYELAAQMFHDIAAQTGDIYCTKKALDLYMLLAEADLGLMDSGLGMSMIEYAVKDINTAYRFITGCMLNHNIMNEIGEHVKAKHADCLFMIGKIKFLQEDPECLDYFKEASSYGKNMANMLAGVWYDKQVSRMLKEEDPDTDLLIEMSKSAIQSFETFIEKYNPSEAESDEFETANLLVSFYYEVGLGTEVDKQHAAEHKQKAGHLNK